MSTTTIWKRLGESVTVNIIETNENEYTNKKIAELEEELNFMKRASDKQSEQYHQLRSSSEARIKLLEEVIGIADSILLLTHPELSNVEMNTLTTRQYILWKEAKAKLSSEESEK